MDDAARLVCRLGDDALVAAAFGWSASRRRVHRPGAIGRSLPALAAPLLVAAAAGVALVRQWLPVHRRRMRAVAGACARWLYEHCRRNCWLLPLGHFGLYPSLLLCQLADLEWCCWHQRVACCWSTKASFMAIMRRHAGQARGRGCRSPSPRGWSYGSATAGSKGIRGRRAGEPRRTAVCGDVQTNIVDYERLRAASGGA